MSTTTQRQATPQVGERVELARYGTPTEQRMLQGQRINGVVRIVDVPATGHGRRYLVEPQLEQDGNAALQALLADYLAQSERLQEIPMATSLLDRYLENLS